MNGADPDVSPVRPEDSALAVRGLLKWYASRLLLFAACSCASTKSSYQVACTPDFLDARSHLVELPTSSQTDDLQ
jgi:hypothetical protein